MMNNNRRFKSFGFALVLIFMLALLASATHNAFAGSGNATLKSLVVELGKARGELSPAFDPAITDYTVLAASDAKEVRVIATTPDGSAEIYVNDEKVESGIASPNIEMAYGRVNTIKITVASFNGTDKKTYSISIVRALSNPRTLMQAENTTNDSISIPPTSFIPIDVAVSPDHDTLCLLDNAYNTAYFADLSTGSMTPLPLPNAPKKVIYAGGAWLVALSTPTANSDAVAIIDPATYTITSSIAVGMDISFIAGDSAYLYTYNSTSKSIDVYGLDIGNKVSSIASSYSLREMEVNPSNGILYCAVGSGGVISFQVTDGQISRLSQNSTYYCSSFAIMPDGKRIVLDCGAVEISSVNKDSDLVYVTKTQAGSLIAADSVKNEIYIVSERLIQVFDASIFTFKRVIPESQATDYLMCSSGKLIIGQKDGSNVLTFRDADAGTLLKSMKINGDAFSEFYPMHFVFDRGTVPYSMVSADIEAEPIFANAVVSGDVGTVPLAVGKNTFTVLVQNPSTGCTQNYTITLTRRASDPPVTDSNAFTDLGFIPCDAVKDPSQPVVYMTSIDGLLYRVDLQTGAITEKQFDLTAESLTIVNGKIYVTLLRTGHQYYDESSENGYGAVAVVDAAAFTVDSIFDTNIDPYDIAADDAGIVYLSPGSNQWSILASYDSTSGRPISTANIVRAWSFLERNPVSGKLYSITTDSSPRDITAYEVSNGVITKYYDSPYHGDYAMAPYMEISPDGKYIFNAAGTIFQSAKNQLGDMVYSRTINQFNAVSFKLSNNRFYIAKDKTLVSYTYSTFGISNTKTFPDHLVALFQTNSNLMALCLNASNILYFAGIDSGVDSVIVTYNSQGGSGVSSAIVPLNSTILAPTPPTRSGYTFQGWYKEPACTHAWNFATDRVTADTTLYAKWASTTPANPKAITASYTSIKVTWSAVPGAAGYQVYQATSSAGPWALKGTVATPSFTSTGLITGKYYYYKIRSYNAAKVYSAFSSVVYTKPIPATPYSVKAARASAGTIRVTWGAVSGATKYEVWRSTSATGTYVLAGTTSSLYFINSRLTAGRTYYFKVRCYHLEGTVKVYSAWSAVVSAKP